MDPQPRLGVAHQTIAAGCSHFEAMKVLSPPSSLSWEMGCHALLPTVPVPRALQGHLLVLLRYSDSASSPAAGTVEWGYGEQKSL